MAEAGTFCVNADVVRKAGAGASSTATAEAYTNVFINDAEAEINVATRYNWLDAYSGLNVDVKYILRAAASNLAAIYCISYDMGGYTSRTEAENMVNILRDGYLRAIAILRDKKAQDFTNDA